MNGSTSAFIASVLDERLVSWVVEVVLTTGD